MSKPNFSTTMLVDQPAETVFQSIVNPRAWWAGEIEGEAGRLGGEFSYRYRDMHWSRQQVTELVPDRKVVWHVAEARINFVKDKSEWTGTDIVFEIVPRGTQTELKFSHVGLAADKECYEDCSNAWGFYVGGSLRSLINTGVGRLEDGVDAEA